MHKKPRVEYPDTNPDTEPLMDVAEVCRRLNASTGTVYNHIEQGRLRAYAVGSKKGYRISEEQLAAFLRASETHPQTMASPEPPPQPTRLKHLSLD